MNDTPDPIRSELIDIEQIQMLIDAGAAESTDLVSELLDLYEGESHQKLEELKTHAATADFDAMSRSAHALAGSSANVGGKLVWQMAKQMENDCKEGRGQRALETVDTLVETHRRTMIALRGFLDNIRKQ